MNEQSRKSLVAANWKMNTLPSQAQELARKLTNVSWTSQLDVLICPPFTHLPYLSEIKKEGFLLGAQNCHEKASGAYTGEISAEMLVDLGCSFVILGHSERRTLNPVENRLLPHKIVHAISAGLKVIYCCGEPISIREKLQEDQFVLDQLEQDFKYLDPSSFDKLVIAYEPIWAIGTGLNATSQQAQAMHLWIRQQISKMYGSPIANKLRIIYGGSVKASNAESLSLMSDIDGVLVGGAGLLPDEFHEIIKVFS